VIRIAMADSPHLAHRADGHALERRGTGPADRRRGLPPLSTARAADRVHAALRTAILDGAFVPGERLDLQALARDLDVSATPLKSAIQMLAAVGLVAIKPRSGTFVAEISADDVAETFAIRRTLECLAVETAVYHVTDETLAYVRRLIARMKDPDSAEQHHCDNSDLHRTLVRLSGNRHLLKIYDELNVHLHIARLRGARSRWRARVAEEHSEHLDILHALEDRSAPRLATALSRHIERAKAVLLASLGSHA